MRKLVLDGLYCHHRFINAVLESVKRSIEVDLV